MPDTINQSVKTRIKKFIGRILRLYYGTKKMQPNLTLFEHYCLIVELLHQFTIGWEKALVGELTYTVYDIDEKEILQGLSGQERLIGSMVIQKITSHIVRTEIDQMRLDNLARSNTFLHYVIRPIADIVSILDFWNSQKELLLLAYKMIISIEFREKYQN